MIRRWRRPVVILVAVAVVVLGAPAIANAAVTATLNPATVRGSDFTWTCDINPSGATIDVTGASFLNAGGSFVETAKQRVSGTSTVRLSFTRDGAASSLYGYRCKWYDTAGNLLGRNDPYLTVMTTYDTTYGAITGTLNDPGGSSASNWEQLYTDHRSMLGNRIGVRVFSGGTIPLATDTTTQGQFMAWIAANHPDEPVAVSFKQYSDATRLNSLMSWAQTYGIRLTVIYYHEPQDNCAAGTTAACPATYKQVYRDMRTAINAHPWHANVSLHKVLSWYWQNFNAASHPGTSWSDYVEPAVGGVKADPADAVTWDAYSPSFWTRYATAAEFMQYALAEWNAAKVPWGYGELGSVILPSDSSRTGWVTAINGWGEAAQTPSLAGSGYAALPPAISVKWWCQYGNSGTGENYHLEQDSRAVAYWAGLVTAHPLNT